MARTRELALPRRSQPQGVAQVNRAHPDAAAGLVFAFEGTCLVSDALGTPMTGPASGISSAVSQHGIVTAYSGSQAALSCASSGRFDGLDGATAAAFDILIYFAGANPTAKFFSQWDADDKRWTCECLGGTLIWVPGDTYGGGQNRSRFDLNGAFPAAGWYRVQGSWAGLGTASLFINGVKRTPAVISSDCSVISGTTLPIQVGASGIYSLSGQVAFARLWRRALSDDEMRRQYNAPWAMLSPISRRVPLPGAAPAGVPDITALYAESILSDRVSYRATLNYA